MVRTNIHVHKIDDIKNKPLYIDLVNMIPNELYEIIQLYCDYEPNIKLHVTVWYNGRIPELFNDINIQLVMLLKYDGFVDEIDLGSHEYNDLGTCEYWSDEIQVHFDDDEIKDILYYEWEFPSKFETSRGEIILNTEKINKKIMYAISTVIIDVSYK